MKILAVDLGDARTGLACCDRTETLASPIGVIHERSPAVLLQKVAAAVAEYSAALVVVGNPINMDGTHGERSQKSVRFAEALEECSGVPVKLWDERRTTVAATDILNTTDTRGKKRRNVIDAVAATLILEGYMSYRQIPSFKEEPQ